jgi:sugar-specific transcriptional regulator TrmB
MGKTKGIKQKIDSIKERIEEHLEKLKKELQAPPSKLLYGYYHFKETIRSMLLILKEEYEKIEQKEKGEIIFRLYLAKLENILRENNCLDEYKTRYLKDFGKYP